MKARAPLPIRSLNCQLEKSDEDLIRAIAKRDDNAMQLLFGRYRNFVFKFTRRMAANDAMADDVVSDVFLAVWRRAATSYDGRSTVATWLLGIARFKYLSEVRGRKEEAWDAGLAERMEDTADDPETALQHKETTEAVQQSLAKLSPKHGQVVELLYYRGKSMKEVAAIVGVSIPTIKTRVFYARRKLSESVRAA
jgi:RNA polymerase sigma-70 factor, ECF subfamily